MHVLILERKSCFFESLPLFLKDPLITLFSLDFFPLHVTLQTVISILLHLIRRSYAISELNLQIFVPLYLLFVSLAPLLPSLLSLLFLAFCDQSVYDEGYVQRKQQSKEQECHRLYLFLLLLRVRRVHE